MIGKYEDPNMIDKLFNVPQQNYLKAETENYANEKLETLNKTIEAKKMEVAAATSSKSSSKIILFVVIGLAVAGLVTVVVLKKKKII